MTLGPIRSLSYDERAELARMAEAHGKRKMDGTDRERFEHALTEAEVELRSVLRLPREQRKRLGVIAKKLRAFAEETQLRSLGEEVELRSLTEEAKRLVEPLQVPLFTEPMGRFADQLEMFAKSKGGTRTDRVPIYGCIATLAQAWEIGSKELPGTATVKDRNTRGGPFVRFVRFALHHMDPESSWDKHPLGSGLN